MNLLIEIRNEIINDSISISTILRKARVLASILQNNDFEKWVLAELNGYSVEAEIPEYRKIIANNIGDFAGSFGSGVRNMPIPTFNIPDYIKKYAEETLIFQGVKSIESLIANENSIIINWPPEFIAICQSKIYNNMNLYHAKKIIGKNSMVQILDTIRNKLLDFILDLQKLYPNIVSEEEINKISPKDVMNAFEAHITGSYNSSQKQE